MALQVPGGGYTELLPDGIKGFPIDKPVIDLPVSAGGDFGRIGDFNESTGRYRTKEDYINPDAKPSIPRLIKPSIPRSVPKDKPKEARPNKGRRSLAEHEAILENLQRSRQNRRANKRARRAMR